MKWPWLWFINGMIKIKSAFLLCGICFINCYLIGQHGYVLKSGSPIVSPDRHKSACCFEKGNRSTDAITQISVNFEYPDCASGLAVFTARGKNLNVIIEWQNDSTLFIKYPVETYVTNMNGVARLKNKVVWIWYSSFLSAKTENKVTADNGILKKEFDVDLSKDIIFSKCIQFISDNFFSAKDVIQSTDKENGKIICSGVMDLCKGTDVRCPYGFTMTIDIRDGRYIVSFKDFVFYKNGKERNVDNKEFVQYIKSNLLIIVKDLNDFMNNADGDKK